MEGKDGFKPAKGAGKIDIKHLSMAKKSENVVPSVQPATSPASQQPVINNQQNDTFEE